MPERFLTRASAEQAPVAEQLSREIETFSMLSQADPKNVSLLYTVGMLYQLAGRPQEVSDHLYKAYLLDPERTDPQLLFHLANNLKAIGENDAAVNFYALAIGQVPTNAVNWVLAAISLDYTGRPQDSVRAFQTVLRLGPSARIESWVDIYLLSALVKVGHLRRALYRYELLVGSLAPYTPRASLHERGGAGAWDASMTARHTGSGWLWDPFSQRSIRLNMHTRAMESHASFFDAALAHRRAFAQLRDAHVAAGGGHEEDLEDGDERWVTQAVQVLQEPAGGCHGAKALVVELGRQDGKTGKIGSEIHGFGFGAQMHVLTIALSYAVRTQRTLVMRAKDNWWYTDRHDCPSRALTCYFEPLGACSEEQVTRGLSQHELGAGGELVMLSAATEGLRVVYSDVRLDNFLNQRQNRVHVPRRVRHRGLLWWRAQLAQYLLRPNAYVRRLVQRERDALGWSEHAERVVGVHVRHGDKKTESAVVPMEQYLDAALEIARGRRGPGKEAARHVIYVSTDDPEALAEARRWQALPQNARAVTVLAREGEGRGVSTATDQVVEMHKVNVTRYGEEAVLNLLLLADCRAFVGTFSSNFGRLAFELAFARRKGDLFGASMDVFWHAYP